MIEYVWNGMQCNAMQRNATQCMYSKFTSMSVLCAHVEEWECSRCRRWANCWTSAWSSSHSARWLRVSAKPRRVQLKTKKAETACFKRRWPEGLDRTKFVTIQMSLILLVEGSLEVKLPTICRDGKAEVGSLKKWEDKKWRKSEERRCTCAKR